MSLKEFDAGSGRPEEAVADAGQRIRLEQVSLYTDPAQNVTHLIALEQLIESPTNPRTTFDSEALQKLADTIRDVGVMQSILVRPVTYAQLARSGEPVQAYEIVFGHRRYRASKLAGVPTIPCFVRELTEAQAAQLQSIENVQREDLNPIEAARSYQQYLAAHGVTKDQLATELGLSRSHVYSYLTLLKAVPAIQEAVEKGEIGPDVGIKISRLHTPKLQERALAAIKGKYYDLEDGGKKSVRQITEFLAEKFTLKLSEAIFDPKDAELVPGADACTACPKRTGNAPEFTDLAEGKPDPGRYYGGRFHGGPNLCTDPDCFDAKKKAHLAQKAAALEARGKTVIAGNKARALVSATGEIKDGYIPLKDVKAVLQKASKGKDAPAVQAITIQNPRDGKLFEVVKAEDLKAAGVKVKAGGSKASGPSHAAEQKRRDEEARQREEQIAATRRANMAVLAAVRKAAAAAPRSAFDLQMVTAVTVEGVGYYSKDLLATLHGFKSFSALEKAIGSMDAGQLTTLMLDCALVENVVGDRWNVPKAETLLKAAKHYGINVAEIRAETAKLPVDVRTEDLLNPVEGKEDGNPAGAALASSPQEPTPAARAPKKAKKAAAAAAKKEDKPGDADASQGEGEDAALAASDPIATWFASLPAETKLKLQGAGVLDRDTLADLSVDELVEITGLVKEDAFAVIVKAREAWFADGQGAAA
jgi:ParB/RepB/Spo0J family partition protein